MEQNISLYIGDNASGKTRILKEIMKQEKRNNNAVVTNLNPYRLNYIPDKNKKQLLLNSNNRLVDVLIADEKIESIYDSQVKSLLELIYAKGDILLIDELDASLKTQDIVYVATAISDCRHLWKRIYINGYSDYITRVFTDYDKETYIESTNYNLYYVNDNMHITKITEEDACGYFDKI